MCRFCWPAPWVVNGRQASASSASGEQPAGRHLRRRLARFRGAIQEVLVQADVVVGSRCIPPCCTSPCWRISQPARPGRRSKVCRGLVQEDHVGLRHEGARHRRPLPFATAEERSARADAGIQAIFQARASQGASQPPPALPASPARSPLRRSHAGFLPRAAKQQVSRKMVESRVRPPRRHAAVPVLEMLLLHPAVRKPSVTASSVDCAPTRTERPPSKNSGRGSSQQGGPVSFCPTIRPTTRSSSTPGCPSSRKPA